MLKRKSTLIFLLVFVLFFGFCYSAQAGILDFLFGEKKIDLKVWANKMVYNGKPIMLTGVAVGDPHSRQTNDKRTVEDYEVIKKEWHANVVRLSVHPGAWKRDEERTKTFLEKEVKAARGQGLFVIIDWHVIGLPDGWYKPCKYGEDHYYSYNSNFNTARNFWQYIAVKYRSDNGVLFELWNEPADPKTHTWDKLRPYMQRLYEIIRSQGAENVVIAPGVWWTYDLRGVKEKPIKGENVAYAWHNYPANGRYLKWGTALDDLNKKYPIFITEWGFDNEPDSQYNTKLEDYPEKFKKFIMDKSLHSTAWCWHSSWKPRLFEWNWEDTTVYGTFAKNFIIEYENKLALKELQRKTSAKTSIAIKDSLDKFVKYGLDNNSTKLGLRERMAIIDSFQLAYGHTPQNQNEISDLLLIANGQAPTQHNLETENRAKNNFKIIYKRNAITSDPRDNMAIMIMSYGLRQKAENRRLSAEEVGLRSFKKAFHRLPQGTSDWNMVQAIAYSGVK